MEFKKVFRGYDPAQVDKYIADTAERETATRKAQRERIEELSEENYNLRERIVELTRRQNDVAEALITAQRVAAEIEQNAQAYADKALLEAKKFYATWQAYSKTIVASFTDEELEAFTNLERKIGEVIANYERKLKGEDSESTTANSEKKTKESASTKKSSPKMSPDEFVKKIEQAAENLTEEANKAEKEVKEKGEQPEQPQEKPANPIKRVEQAAGQSIDLRELLRPEQSLEDICSDLGLINPDDE